MSLRHDFHLGFIVCKPYKTKPFRMAGFDIFFNLGLGKEIICQDQYWWKPWTVMIPTFI